MKTKIVFLIVLSLLLIVGTSFGSEKDLVLVKADDGAITVTANGADEGTEITSSIIIGEEFPALDIETALVGDSCFSVTLTDVRTGEEKLVVIEAFTRTSHYYVAAGEYTVRFIVKNKAVGGTITIRSCDGSDGESAKLAAMLGAEDDFPIFSFVYGEGGIDEAVSRGAANSVRGSFSEETQLTAGIPLSMKIFDDGDNGMDVFSWAAVYALKAEENSWKTVGYLLAPVKMNLKMEDNYFFKVSDVRWAVDGEIMRSDLEEMCAGHEGLADELMDNIPTGEEADEALVKALCDYMKINSLDFASKLITYGSEYDLDAAGMASDSSGFVLLSDFVPDAILEIRYYSTYNFVGDRIAGYEEPLAFLTREAAAALSEVSDDLAEKGYRLKIYDAYRPQMAVDHFVAWAEDTEDTRMKQYFYPELDKSVLFPQGYIDRHSGHSRGSTVDLTLFDMTTEKEVDMGGTFDYFGELSHPDYTDITEEQYANRMILREAMMAHGFRPLPEEWWHFTLNDEPYPDTYFTFAVNSNSLEY